MRKMRLLFTLLLISLVSMSYAIEQFHIEFPDYRIAERHDFDEKLFTEQLSSDQLRRLNGDMVKLL